MRDLGAVVVDRDQAAVGEPTEDACGVLVAVDVELGERDAAAHRRIALARPGQPQEDAARAAVCSSSVRARVGTLGKPRDSAA